MDIQDMNMNFATTAMPETLPLMDAPGPVELPRIESRIKDAASTDNESGMRESALASAVKGLLASVKEADTCPCVMCAPRVNFTAGELREAAMAAIKKKGKRPTMTGHQGPNAKKARVVRMKPTVEVITGMKKDAVKGKTVTKKAIAKGQQAAKSPTKERKTAAKSKKITSAVLKKPSAAEKKKPATPVSKKSTAASKKAAAGQKKAAAGKKKDTAGKKKVKIAAGVGKKASGKATKKPPVANKKKTTVAKSVKKAPARKVKAN